MEREREREKNKKNKREEREKKITFLGVPGLSSNNYLDGTDELGCGSAASSLQWLRPQPSASVANWGQCCVRVSTQNII